MKRLLLIAGLLLAATGAIAEPANYDDDCGGCGGRTQLFDEDGNHIGVAVEVGDRTILYADNGKKVGSMKYIGNKAIYYDARGKRRPGGLKWPR
jgi:hypothetical protein